MSLTPTSPNNTIAIFAEEKSGTKIASQVLEAESFIRETYQIMVNRGIETKRLNRTLTEKQDGKSYDKLTLTVNLDETESLSASSIELIRSIARDGRSVNVYLILDISL